MMKTLIKLLWIILALITLTVVSVVILSKPTHAQVSNQYWKALSNVLQPVTNTYQLQVPQLGGSGDRCIHVDNTGLFSVATADCGTGGSGGGADGNWVYSNTLGGFIRLATTTNRTGVGTTSPYAMLSVASNAVGTTTLALRPIASQTANILDIFSTTGVLNSVITAANRLGLGTSTPWRTFSVNGSSDLGTNALAGYFTATTSTASVFPTANITKLSNLTSNGFVKTGSADGTLSVDTNSYLTGSGAGVTSVSVASSNGLAGSSSGGATPTLTLSTSITGVLKGNGTAISAAANGTDYTLLTSTTCGAGAHISAVTAAGAVTCSADSGGGGGGTGVGWLWNSINSLYQSTTTDDVVLGAIATTSTAKLEVIAGGTKPAAYFNGKVGIGTSSPYAMLSVAGEVVGQKFTATSSSATSTFAGSFAVGSSTPYEKFEVVGNSVFNVGAAAPIYIGQNKSSPSYNLISMNGGMTDSTFQGFGGGGSTTFLMQSLGDIVFRTGGTNTRMTLLSTGNVGVGTTSPYTNLAVEGTSGITVKYSGVNTPGFLYANSGGSVALSSNVSASNVVQDATKYQWSTVMSQASDSFSVYRSPAGATWSPASLLYIDNMGDVGIGTTSPYARLSVVGEVVGANFTATTSTKSTFPYASTTAVTVSGALYTNSLTGLLQGNGTSAVSAISNSSTVGQVLRVSGASTFSWGALDLADTDAITGNLPVSNLNSGTGASASTFWRGDGTWATPAGGGGGVTGGTAGMLASWVDSTTLTATGTPTAASYVATSSTATSTFAGGLTVGGALAVGTSSPVAGPNIVFGAGSSILCPQVLLATSTSMTVDMSSGCHVVLRMGTSNATITMTGGYAGSIQTQTLCNPNAFGGAVTYLNVLYATDATAVANSTTTNSCTRNIIEKTMATSTDIYRVIGQQIIK